MSEKSSIRSSKIDSSNPEVHYIKQIIPKRWKEEMIDVLDEMKDSENDCINLIVDLRMIVGRIPEADFIQAALDARPFKPEFVQQPVFKGLVSQSTTASTIARVAKFKDEKIKSSKKLQKKQLLTQKNLKQQFNKEYHPFRFIIKNFRYLLELKYKQKVDVKKATIRQVNKWLRRDLDIFTQFLTNSAMPYRKLFKNQKKQANQQLSLKKLQKFIQGYVFDHPKLNSTCHKIILYTCRHQYHQYFLQKMPDFVTPDQYDIPADFKIDGCYIRSMNSLMQFSQSSDHKNSMDKLLEFRANILKDIDQYYASKKENGEQGDVELEVSAEIQIQIIRFVLGKLKGWACEIYSQLKYLELVYGDEEIAYKYEQGSFMYTQLILAFNILGIQQ